MSDKAVRETVLPVVSADMAAFQCERDDMGHCITCSDEAIAMLVVQVDQSQGMASVHIDERSEEVDVTLIDDVSPGDLVLVHGGVAIAHLGRAGDQ